MKTRLWIVLAAAALASAASAQDWSGRNGPPPVSNADAQPTGRGPQDQSEGTRRLHQRREGRGDGARSGTPQKKEGPPIEQRSHMPPRGPLQPQPVNPPLEQQQPPPHKANK